MNTRPAGQSDRDDIIEIYLSAFNDDEKDIVAKLAVELLNESSDPAVVSLIVERDGTLLAHSALSPVGIENDRNDGNSDDIRGYILAPVAVRPDCQKQRIGSSLIESGLRALQDAGIHIVFVYGDPSYYERFGFRTDLAAPFSPPYKLTYPSGWQALVLNEMHSDFQQLSITCLSALNHPELW